jgi:hypothetical protein
MKGKFLLSILVLVCLLVGLIDGCKKDKISDCPPENSTPTDVGIKTSFTEEFDNVYQLSTKGWVIKDNTPTFNNLGLVPTGVKVILGMIKRAVGVDLVLILIRHRKMNM